MSTATQPIVAPQPYRFTVEEYMKMADIGLFEDKRVELIEGVVTPMNPQNARHAVAVDATWEVLKTVFGKGFWVRSQSPLNLSDYSSPEPDVAVVTGKRPDYRDHHPSTALLVVEVSETSLAVDRTIKRDLYARHEIPEYWIVNLVNNQLEVFRQPQQGVYQESFTLQPGDRLRALSAASEVLVADLLS